MAKRVDVDGSAPSGHFLPFCVTRHRSFDIWHTVSADQFWQYRLNKVTQLIQERTMFKMIFLIIAAILAISVPGDGPALLVNNRDYILAVVAAVLLHPWIARQFD